MTVAAEFKRTGRELGEARAEVLPAEPETCGAASGIGSGGVEASVERRGMRCSLGHSAIVLLALFPWIWGCAETSAPAPADAPAGELALTADADFLMRGDSTALHAEFSRPRDAGGAELTYLWEAEGAAIRGEGGSAVLYAPTGADTVTVRVTAVDAEGNAFRSELRLPVVRQFVILKADDFVYESFCADGVPAGWRLYLDYVESRGLKTSVGVIGHRLAEAPPSFFALLGEMHRRGRVEFFNHGWTHAINVVGEDGVERSEFKGTPYETQRDNLRATQALLRRRAGIVLRGFGAPGNAIDATTAQVVAENEEILYWFFGHKDGGKTVLPRVADIENARLLPDYETFRRTLKPEARVVVYQIHPWFWTPEKLAEFARCIDDLAAQGVTFVLPAKYCGMRQPVPRSVPALGGLP